MHKLWLYGIFIVLEEHRDDRKIVIRRWIPDAGRFSHAYAIGWWAALTEVQNDDHRLTEIAQSQWRPAK